MILSCRCLEYLLDFKEHTDYPFVFFQLFFYFSLKRTEFIFIFLNENL
jgi:hypothetical protein